MKYTTQIPTLAALAVSAIAYAGDTPESATPIVLSDSPVDFSGVLSSANGANLQLGSGCSSHTGTGDDVFYSFSLDVASAVTLDMCGSEFDTDLTIHLASDPTVVVACDGDSSNGIPGCGAWTSLIEEAPLPAGDYIIRIGGYFGATGPYRMTGSAVAGDPCEGAHPNDDPDFALPIILGEAVNGSITACANNEVEWNAPECGTYFEGDGRDVFYSFSLDAPAVLNASLCGSDFDTDLSIHFANNLEIVPGACNDDACGFAGNYASEFTGASLEAGDYLVRVGSYGGETGDFTLIVSTESVNPCDGLVPENDALIDNGDDTYSAATTISVGDVVTGSTACAGIEFQWGEPTECGPYFTGLSKDVFFELTLDETTALEISLCGSTFDTSLSVHNTSSTLNILACNDDSCGGDFDASLIESVVLNAGTYIIRVAGYAVDDGGDFSLSVTETVDPCDGQVPANDLITNALPITPGTQVSGSTDCANEETTFTSCETNAFTGIGNDVFYSLDLQEAALVIMTTCESDFDTDLSIHNESGDLIVCDGDGELGDGCQQYSSRIETELQPGSYIVRVGGYNAATGNFALDVTLEAPCETDVYSVSDVQEVLDVLATACGNSTINWAPGIYDFGETLDLNDSGFIHIGAVDASGAPATVITGNDTHRCLSNIGSGGFENFVFENGLAGGDGGAFILSPSGKATFENCVFRNNVSGGNGGAVCNLGAQYGSEFINCVFLNNSGNDAGAAFANGNGADGAIFTLCEFIGNTAANTGGGICTFRGNPTVVDCVFTNNTAVSGGGIYISAGFFPIPFNDRATVSGTTFCDNDPDAYAGPGIFDDQGGNEFACDEPACPEDVDENGSVDFADILAVLSAWGTDDAAADVDESGTVDFADVLALLSAWGSC